MSDELTLTWTCVWGPEEKRAYEVGRKVAFTKVSSFTYGKGFRNEWVERAYERGYRDEQQAEQAKIDFDVGRWNIAIEKMVPHLRVLEEISRSIPGQHGELLRKKAQGISSRISDAISMRT